MACGVGRLPALSAWVSAPCISSLSLNYWARPGGTSQKPDPGHTDTISITVLVRRTRWNAMKPRIHCVREAPGLKHPGSDSRSLSRLLRLARACSG